MFLIKLLALPLVAVVTLIQWVAIFLTSFSAILFDLLAGIIFMVTLAGLMFGVCTGIEALKMLAVHPLAAAIQRGAQAESQSVRPAKWFQRQDQVM